MKYAHIEEKTNRVIGWYADDMHGIWVEPVYEKKVIQEEIKDDDGNIVQNVVFEDVLVKDGFYDVSNIPTPNIEVSDEEWQLALSTAANFLDDNGKLIYKDFRTEAEVYKGLIPKLITMRQTRLYLLSLNLLDEVEAFVSQNQAWQIEWEYANEVLRTNQLITAMQNALNLSDEQVDTMFLEASKL